MSWVPLSPLTSLTKRSACKYEIYFHKVCLYKKLARWYFVFQAERKVFQTFGCNFFKFV